MAVTSMTFDTTYYLNQNPDVLTAILNGSIASAEQHYNLFGYKELRDPNASFDTSYYLTQNPDVLAAGVNPFEHFKAFGAAETRAPTETLASAGASFDSATYLAANPDVQAAVNSGAFANAYQHWVLFGQFEARAAQTTDGTTLTGASSTTGSTFTLTNTDNQTTGGVDNLTGTANNDTFVALANNAFDNSDIIAGGAGTDTLQTRYSLTANKSVNGSVTGVEQVSIDLDDGSTAGAHTLTFNVGSFTGLSKVTVTNAESDNAQKDTVNVTNIASGVTVAISGGDEDYIADFDYATAATEGASDAATLDLAAAKADQVIIAGIETVTINASSGASTLDKITTAQATKYVFTGSGDVTLSDLDNATATGLKTFDASAATGKIALAGMITGDVSITGGSANDTFTLAGGLDTGDTINGGAGTDRVVVNVAETAALSKLTNVEELEIEVDGNGGTDYEISGAVSSGIGTFVVDANDNDFGNTDALAVTISNMTTGNTIIVDDTSSDTADADGTNITATFATDGVEDVLNVNFAGIGATGAASTTGMDTLTVDQAETLNLASNKNSTSTVSANGLEALSAQAAKSIVITGAADLAVAAVTNTSALTSIDASAMTGALTLTGLDASNLTFKAGSGDTTITMTGLNNSDTITGGASTKDVLNATTVTGLTSTTGKLSVTNFETINLGATGANTIDASGLSGVTTLAFSGATPGTQTITNLGTGVAIGIGTANAKFDGGSTIDASLADASGTTDSLSFSINPTAAAANAAIKTSNIETLNFAVAAGSTNNTTLNMANAAAASLVFTGGATGQDLALGTLNAASTSLDTSGFTGDVTVSVANATAATTIKTGAAESATTSITGSGQADTITVGETGAADLTVNGGAGTDTLNLSVKNGFVDTSNITNVENINLTVKAGDNVTVTNAGGFNNAATDNIKILGGNALSTFTTGTLTAATIQTLDASGFSGNLVATFGDDNLTSAITITGGALTTDSVTASFNTSGGTTTIKSSAVETITLVIDSGDNGTDTETFDLTSVSGAAIVVRSFGTTAADTANFTGVSSGQVIQLGDATEGFNDGGSVGVTLTSSAGTTDALTFKLFDTEAAAATNTLTAAGIEALTIENTGTTAHSINIDAVEATASSNQTVTLTGTGTGAVTLTAVDATANVIDASAVSYAVTVSDRGSSAMTITGGSGADNLKMENASDVMTGGSGTDTLTIGFNAVLGGIEINLANSGDQITTFNGSANSVVQSGFENVNVSGYTGSFGTQVTAAAGGSIITGTANSDVITLGAGADDVRYASTGQGGAAVATGANSLAGGDVINSFTSTADDIIVLGDNGSTNAAVAGNQGAWNINNNAVFILNSASATVAYSAGTTTSTAIATAIGNVTGDSGDIAYVAIANAATPTEYNLFEVTLNNARAGAAIATTDTIAHVATIGTSALVAGDFEFA